jgi:hypothetical protein
MATVILLAYESLAATYVLAGWRPTSPRPRDLPLMTEM